MQRRKQTKEAATALAAQLKDSEYGLMEAVSTTDLLTIREAGKLVAMHRKLRRMRHEVELKAGIW